MHFRLFSIFCFCCLSGVTLYADESTVRRLLVRYEESLGGIRQIDALSSISIEGVLSQGEEHYEFLLRKKRPGMIRYQLQSGTMLIFCGFDGDVGWKQIQSEEINLLEDLDESALELLKEEASFESPLIRHLEKTENHIKLIGNQVTEGVSVYVISLTDTTGRVTRYHLSSRNSQLLKRERLSDDGSVALETVYRDYREIDGYLFPHSVENRVAGETVSQIEVGKIIVNPGLLSFYFEKPIG